MVFQEEEKGRGVRGRRGGIGGERYIERYMRSCDHVAR